jgi:rubrerythrin
MRHMSWVASYVPGLVEPRPPDVPADRVRWVDSTAEARELAGKMEDVAQEFYAEKVDEAHDPTLTSELERAAGQHDYHRYRLDRMG